MESQAVVKCSRVVFAAVSAIAVAMLAAPSPSHAVLIARDPGLRGGAAGAGGPIPGLTANQLAYFNAGATQYANARNLGDGLGPRFNGDSCGLCHSQPAIGGTSPATNPLIPLATAFGAQNTVPSFLAANGPAREARFVKKPDGSPDGGVHDLFVISGRVDSGGDASGCAITQDDFETQLNNNNVIFRIPTPVFGMGLVESITDQTIVDNLAVNAAVKIQFGIFGHVNHVSGNGNNNGNDGTIARFGWKAQNKSALLFVGEASNVELGISNEIFVNEREEDVNCQFDVVPNDIQNTDATTALEGTTRIEHFANFQRFLAPPTPVTSYTGANGSVSSTSINRGRQRFIDVGCHLCHTPTLTTSPTTAIAALRSQPANLFSDLAVHGMGPGLADRVSQGQAGGDEFRTAPLWGLGQRIFLLHDGRTTDLRTAIDAHKSSGNSQFPDSEANTVVDKFDALNGDDTQDLFNFLRSL